jgi:hypothetical protein
MLPLGVFLGHNATYILVGFICLFFVRSREDQEAEEQLIDETNLLLGYRFAAMLFSLIFLDNLLRWIDGRGDSNWFCLCSVKLEILILSRVLSLAAHFLVRDCSDSKRAAIWRLLEQRFAGRGCDRPGLQSSTPT